MEEKELCKGPPDRQGWTFKFSFSVLIVIAHERIRNQSHVLFEYGFPHQERRFYYGDNEYRHPLRLFPLRFRSAKLCLIKHPVQITTLTFFHQSK